MSEATQETEPTIAFRGKIFEVEQIPKPDGRVFEVARRAPGVRLIIADKPNKKLLLTREYRWELKTHDYRLPGGKVFDTLEAFDAFRQSGSDIVGPATAKAREEAAEEAGMQVDKVELFKRSMLGATVEWDLYVFEATAWQPHADGQNLQEDEQQGIDVLWIDYDEVRQMILGGQLQEERVALILLQWLTAQEV